MRAITVFVVLGALATPAAADPNDLVLSRLGYSHVDAMGNTTLVTGEPLEFRELASQLGVVLAPELLTPADTLGFSGFQFSVDYATTSIDQKASYWKALDGPAPAMMRTVGFFARKGMWLPVPSV
jgi:gamma-glutamyltranspeptidase